ncbi:DedA family protein [Luteipulveratus mongoliensis]|uniref:Membrane protein n=1 Tax=Luteipulveratus mongoliensis TaxID=571913 RepID=A0A0K1JHK1_9MICO|nr:DedA family protein [Luteipulveratus mongoliensis]AKU16070.1 membrane protein [Luteipulveratus mongoliensis]
MNVEHWLVSVPPILVYVLAGGVVGLESIGIPLPGEIVLVTAALLASRHELDVSPHGVALAAVVGAVVGDSIGYAVGRRYGDRLFGFLGRRFPDHVNDDLLAYARHLFSRYGMVAVFFGRFVALLRIFAGPLSGSLQMAYPRFLVANVCGAIAWAGGTTYLVYYVGTAAESWLKGFSFVGLGIAVVVGITASTVLRRRVQRNVEAYAAARRAAEGV